MASACEYIQVVAPSHAKERQRGDAENEQHVQEHTTELIN